MFSSKTLKTLSFLLIVIMFVMAPISAKTVTTNDTKIQEKIREIYSLDEREIDLAKVLLWVSMNWRPALKKEDYYKTIDTLVARVREDFKNSLKPARRVEILRNAIHKGFRFRYTEQVDEQGLPLNSEELFLHGLLETRNGYCMTLSLIYLIVGEKLNLPLYGVALPNHFFVRYDSPEYKVNIETTQGGTLIEDVFYRKRFGVSKNDPFFMKNLDKKQTLGAYFSNIGAIYYKKNDLEKAAFYLEQSTAINPNSLEARNNLGNIYSELKRYKLAIKHYQAALKSDPLNVATLFNLGIAYNDSGNTSKAVEMFLQAVQIDPLFVPAHKDLAQLFLREKKFIEALLHLKQLAKLEPNNIGNHLNIVDVYLHTGAPNLALSKLELIEREVPDDDRVSERIAEAYYRLKKFDQAIERYRFAIEKQPGDLRAYIQLGWIYYRKGESDWALAWTRQGIARSESDNKLITLAWMNMGFFSLLEKRFDDAKSWYRKVLGKKDHSTLNAMLQDIKEAEKEQSEFNELTFFKGWLFMGFGLENEAATHLKKYLNKNPQGPFAKECREILLKLHGTNTFIEKTSSKPNHKTSNEENMIKIPAGLFIMGSIDKQADERPMQKVYLNEYFIDRYEVSSQQYSEFLNEKRNGKYFSINKYGTLEFEKGYRPRKGLENLPINNISWAGARAYCRSKNKRLPTEAEWEKAARGSDGGRYPWGNEPPNPEKARFLMYWEELKARVMVPVDTMPQGKSPYGLFHMAGNVKEWVDDWYDREYYSDPNHGSNPIGPLGGEYKVLKGGSWRDLPGFLYSSYRNNNDPSSGMEDYGFRCAKDSSKDSSSSFSG